MHEFKKKIPNILTTFRLALVPVFWWAFWNPDRVFPGRMLAFGICLIAGVTDMIDGFLARRFHAVSNYGKLVDPLADKLLTISVLLCFMMIKKMPTFLVAIFLAKDLTLCLGAIVLLRRKDVVVYSDFCGKAATYLCSMGLALTFFEGTSPWNMYVLYIGTGVALIAFARYTLSAVRQLLGKR